MKAGGGRRRRKERNETAYEIERASGRFERVASCLKRAILRRIIGQKTAVDRCRSGLVPGTGTVGRAPTERSNQGALGAGAGAGSRPLFFFAACSNDRMCQQDGPRKQTLEAGQREAGRGKK